MKIVGQTKNGQNVHAQKWIEEDTFLIPLSEIVESIEVDPNKYGFQQITLTFDKDVGYEYCIAVTPFDEVYYAVDTESDSTWQKKFVKDKNPILTKIVRLVISPDGGVICLWKIDAGNLILKNPFDWELHMQEAEDPNISFKNSTLFWENHAWVEQTPNVQIDKSSITKDCPW